MTSTFQPIDLSLIGKTEEIIETLVFRNKASVSIRKIKRERAFTQAVDIIIRSIDYGLSENFKANPPIQFYGYATLVMQDCTQIAIPIVFPRQRLYYGFQPEAFRQWRHWIEFYQLYQLHRINDINLSKLLVNSQIDYIFERPELANTGWIELPIREVYIKVREDCQFELEFSQWQGIPFIDPISGVNIEAKSRQPDGDKDNGLPKDGIQPKQNPPSNPFGGNPTTSSLENAGIKGFDLIDDSKLNGADPENGLTPEQDASFGYFAKIETSAKYGGSFGCRSINSEFYFLVASNTTSVRANETAVQSVCGSSLLTYSFFAMPNNDSIVAGAVVNSYSASIVRAANKPPDRFDL